jgi:hypothetical protein
MVLVEKNGFEAQVMLDVAGIAVGDAGGVGDKGYDATYLEVEYRRSVRSTVTDRLQAVVNDIPRTSPIRVAGVDDTYQLEDGTQISQVAGFFTSTPLDPGAFIWYDVSQCGGLGRLSCDSAGNRNFIPNSVLLYHELAHAFHLVNHTFDRADQEGQAVRDENDLEAALGLPLRDPSRYGTCGGCAPVRLQVSSDCFIATAAVGTAGDRRLDELRTIRDWTTSSSAEARAFFEALHAEYYRFSPAVASDLRRSQKARALVRRWLVEPFIDALWIILLQLNPRSVDGIPADATRAILDRSAHGPGPVAEALAAELGELEARLSRGDAEPRRSIARARSPVDVVRCVGSYALSVGSPLPAVAWGVVAPLRMYWELTAQRGAVGVGRLVDEWVDRFPSSSIRSLADRTDIRAAVANLAFGVPTARTTWAGRSEHGERRL